MSQRVYMVATFLLLGVSAAALANRYVLPNLGKEAPVAEGGSLAGGPAAEGGSVYGGSFGTLGEAGEDAMPLSGRASVAEIEWSDSTLAVGIPTTVPDAASLPTVEDLPWSLREAGEAFRGRRAEPAELVPPGGPVVAPLSRGVAGSDSALGRVPAFTVGLKVDPLARRDIPSVSRGAIDGYMDDHLLMIQPTLYRDASGRVFLGPTVRAAFFARDDPSETVEPEGMIAAAVRQFRAVGLYEDEGVAPGQTLVLEFRYISGESGRVGGTGRQEYELLFIHLMGGADGDGEPRLTAFATGEGRQTLHALDVSNPLRAGGTPAVTATVRFDEFTTMGLYPAKPVVTGVRHAAVASIPSERFRAIMNGEGGAEPVPLPEMLDRLARGELPAE